MEKKNLKGLTLRELEEFCVSIGEARYRGRQLFNWLYSRGASSFDEMSSFSKGLREKMTAEASIGTITPIAVQKSRKDGTTKYLFGLPDGLRIESVLIPPRTAFAGGEAGGEDEQRRLTLCVSTQAGCPLGCRFCATATMGLQRNLEPGEIVDQVLQVNRDSGRKITNLVYMGMGEPLLNYENVMGSIEIITTGLDIAARRLTVSTAGIVPGIRRMADERCRVKLAISLHSLDDQERARLMPINKKYGVAEILEAAEYYYMKVKSRLTFEYVLFENLNDRDEDIRHIVRLSKRIPCKFNIIPFHSIEAAGEVTWSTVTASLHPSSHEHLEQFVARLRQANVTVFVRSSAGEDIDAACGQLAARSGGAVRRGVTEAGPSRSRPEVRTA